MSQFRRVLATATVVSAVGILLSGCFAVPAFDKAKASHPAPAPSPSVVIEEKGDPGTMTFEDGAKLAPDEIAQWSDGLMADDGWKLSTPDDGNGSWAYTTVDGTCSAKFWQGKVFDMTATDDVAASDFVLAALFKTKVENLNGKVSVGKIGYKFAKNPTAEYRYVVASSSGNSRVVALRGFAQLKAAMYLIVDCKSDQAVTVTKEVVSKTAIFVGG